MPNRPQYLGVDAHHYEVWYLTFNHQESQTGFWLRYTLLNPDDPTSQEVGGLWFARFNPHKREENLALRAFYPRDEVHFTPNRLNLSIGPGSYEEGHMTASFQAEGHEISWDLHYEPNAVPLLPVHPIIEHLPMKTGKVTVPNVDLHLHGTIRVDGQEYTCHAEPGGQAHHWGDHYPKGWIWAHGNAFEDRPGSYLEWLTVRLQRGRVTLPPMTMLTFHDAQHGRTLQARRPWDLPRVQVRYHEGRWLANYQQKEFRLEAEWRCDMNDMVTFPYTSPTLEPYFCHNSCVCDALVRVYRKSRHPGANEEKIDELICRNMAAAELCLPGEADVQGLTFQGSSLPFQLEPSSL